MLRPHLSIDRIIKKIRVVIKQSTIIDLSTLLTGCSWVSGSGYQKLDQPIDIFADTRA